MEPLDEHILRRRVDVFTIPGRPFPSLGGVAFGSSLKPRMNIFAPPGTPEWYFLYWHELYHLMWWFIRHESALWREELAADMYALDKLAEAYPYDVVYQFDQWVKERFRSIIQEHVDEDIFVHGEADLAVWAGCDIKYDKIWWGD